MTRVAQARKHFWTFERTATDNESTLHSTFIHAISLPPTMFTRLRQDANDSLFVLRPWCNVIRVRTPPGRYLLGRHCLVANPNVILSFRLLRKTKIWQHLLHYADYTTSKVIIIITSCENWTKKRSWEAFERTFTALDSEAYCAP